MKKVLVGRLTVKNGEKFVDDVPLSKYEEEFSGYDRTFITEEKVGNSDKVRITISDRPFP